MSPKDTVGEDPYLIHRLLGKNLASSPSVNLTWVGRKKGYSFHPQGTALIPHHRLVLIQGPT